MLQATLAGSLPPGTAFFDPPKEGQPSDFVISDSDVEAQVLRCR